MSELAGRFAAITDRHFEAPLEGGFVAREVGSVEWRAVFAEIGAHALPEENLIKFAAIDNDRPSMAPVRDTELSHHILIYEGDTPVGCYAGLRDFRGWYYMQYTAIEPTHHGRGIYSSFLDRLIAAVDEIGFHAIYSRHRADNNAVLIPKLKRGFVITGLEISLKYGAMVELRNYLVRDLVELHGFRIDGARNHAELRRRAILED